MKFAKELEQDLVPEWRVKYLNYKAGKKYVKSVSRAINRANGTPLGAARNTGLPPHVAPGPFARQQENDGNDVESLPTSPAHESPTPGRVQKPQRIQRPAAPEWTERQSLTHSPGNETRYGSIIESRNEFELPDPALGVPSQTSDRPVDSFHHKSMSRLSMHRSTSMGPPPSSGHQSSSVPRPSPLSHYAPSPGRLKRLFSAGQQLGRTESKLGYGLQALDTVRQREKEFFDFLDGELEKVETFYRQKEEQAGNRLALLREQLHEMRNRRTQELADLRRNKERENGHSDDSKATTSGYDSSHNWMDPIKTKIFKPGANSKALSKMPLTPVFSAIGGDARRDYIRKPPGHDVPYRTAKRKLKMALEEFYRGLELLKSYTLLNRTAFRKLNKKYDKAVNARPPYRYMNEKVNKAWFVNSDIVDGHIRAVEDLYARYFEKGNHKLAAGKLRRLNRRPGDESAIAFRNGLFIGTGVVFTIQGLVYGAQLLYDPDPTIRLQTSYILQLYGGYFLMLVLMFLFCINCYIWTTNKINYPFIFEFDARNNLDWRQLSSFPSFFLLLFGVFFWVNFTRYGSDELYLYYPVILIGITLIILLLPAPILWHRSRQWFMYSHYRLFFAGLYPVEFRDFFLGDMYCSLTYSTANVELFFCLYAHYWNDPVQCNSNNSRLLGFFCALPPIWRLFQCIRRYRDTKNVFPHLVNGGKYGMTILSAITLSLYRINGTNSNLGLFVAFSAINGIYTSIWDLFMDFSFFQPDTRHRFLRDILGLKRRWVYYVIMILDPILRFCWIFYAIFTHDKQHSTVASFVISLAEVTRRGMWALFRVENEHCANVAQYKASRDVPLPYRLEHEPLVENVSEEAEEHRSPTEEAVASGFDVSTVGASAYGREEAGVEPHMQTQAGASGRTPSVPEVETGLRRRRRSELRRTKSIRGIMAEAHMQDFEKRRRPPEPPAENEGESADEMPSDDDEDETGSMLEERMEVRRVESLVRGSSSKDEDKP